MDRNERVRACFQHCALLSLSSEYMTNASLRNRFKLSESKAATVSQVISAAEKEGLVKQDLSIGKSKKFSRYVPFWH